MIKRTRIQQWLAAVAMVAVLPLAAATQGKEPVKIGLVWSKTGSFSSMGVDVANAVRFAVDEANANGGVDGRAVQLAEADDEGTPEAGRRAAEKLVREGHKLLIGPIPSSISLALMQHLDRWDAALIGTMSKADKLTGEACSARFIRTNHSDAMDLAMISRWAKELKGHHFAILAADYVWGHDSAKAFEEAVRARGKKVSLKLFVPMGTKDYAPYIQQLKAANVDGIWVADVAGGIAFVAQAADAGLIPATPLIGHALVSNFIINATGKALDNVPGNVGFTPDIDTLRTRAFVAAWQARFGRLPSDTEGQAYNGAIVLFEGIRLARSVAPEAVTRALRGAQVETLYGRTPIRAADNQAIIPNYVARAKVVDGVLRPVIEQSFPGTIAPPPSPVCRVRLLRESAT